MIESDDHYFLQAFYHPALGVILISASLYTDGDVDTIHLWRTKFDGKGDYLTTLTYWLYNTPWRIYYDTPFSLN